MDYKTTMVEFEKGFNNEEDVNIVKTENYDGVSSKRKHFIGVSRKGNKWRARIQHPKLKVRVHLGCYSTPEEAALVVKNKKAEFEGTLKAEDGLNERKLPRGVDRRKSGKFRVRIWLPESKRYASFGSYSTCEEAAVVADRKRSELRELYAGKPRGHVDNDVVLQDCESEAAVKFECADEQMSDVKVPITGMRIKDPASDDRIWLETCDTSEELGSDGLNKFEIGDKPNCGVVDVPDKLECEFVHDSVKMSQRKTTCSLEFDEAVSAGFINEYGQLMGKYRELDELLWLGLPDENFTASG